MIQQSTMDPVRPLRHTHSSRQRYRRFVGDYKQRRLDDLADAGDEQKRLEAASAAGEDVPAPEPRRGLGGKRREYLGEYLRWLRPHRYSVAGVFLFALTVAGL